MHILLYVTHLSFMDGGMARRLPFANQWHLPALPLLLLPFLSESSQYLPLTD